MSIREDKNKAGEKRFIAYVGGRDARGKRVQKIKRGLKTRREAEKAEFELKRQIARMRESEFPYTWEEWIGVCVERMEVELKPSTIQAYTGKNRHWIEPHFRGKELSTITPRDVHAVVYNPEKEAAWYTRKTVLKIIKRIFTMAVDDGIIRHNPALKVSVKVPQVRQAVLNKTEVDILLKKARSVEHRFYPIWATALLTGMRSGELYALKWSDVDLESGKIYVVRAWNSKNGTGPTKTAQNRVVPISASLKELLSELKLKGQKDHEYVLPHLTEWRTGYQAQILKEFCEGIGITPVRFHDLRATFITRLLSQGVAVAVVMAIVGHNQLKTTQAYLRLAGIELEGATEKLDFDLPDDQGAQVINLSEIKK
jgi:integrase